MFEPWFKQLEAWFHQKRRSLPGQPQHPAAAAATTSKDDDLESSAQELERIKKLARDLLTNLSTRRIALDNIEFSQTGTHDSGAKGDVVVATLRVGRGSIWAEGGKRVAVKKLKVNLETDMRKLLKAFVNELRILDKLSHPHVVEMVGFVEDIENGTLWAVFPWEDNGNVREFLRSRQWEIPERVSLIKDVAMGLEYLHHRQPPICHGDLKSLNILVNDSRRAVITDFGSARAMNGESRTNRDDQAPTDRNVPGRDQSWEIDVSISNNQLTLTGPSWSFRWAAPEMLNGEEPDLASDVWAFGWICWEVMTDNYPFAETNGLGLITLMVTGGQLPSMDAHDQLSQIQLLCNIMVRCWKPEPTKRPSVMECRRGLTWIPSSIPAPDVTGESSIRSAALLHELGETHRLHSRYDEAAEMLEQGLAIARSTLDKQLLARISVTLGLVHETKGRYAEAEECYTQASAIYTAIGNDIGRAEALGGLGDLQRAREKFAEAEEYYTQALDIHTSRRNDVGRANALDRLGYAQRMRSKYVEAEESYTKALEIYTSGGNDLGRANTVFGLGEVHQMRSKYAEAEEFYTQSLEIYKSIGNHLGRANALKALGDIQRGLARAGEAEASYTQALEIFKRFGGYVGQTNCSLELGEIRLRQGRYPEAKALITDAAEIAERIHYTWGRQYSKQLLADVLAAEKPSPEPSASTLVLAPAATENSVTPPSPL